MRLDYIALTSALSGVFLSLGLDQMPIMVFGGLMVIDFVTGVMASWVVDKTTVTSKSGLIGLIKKLSVFLVPFVVALVAKGAGYESLGGMVTVVVSLLIVVEGYSVIGNVYRIHTKKAFPEPDAMSMVLEKILNAFGQQLPPKSETQDLP